MATYQNVNAANQYARDIVGGKILACQLTVLACQRHLDDLERAKDRSSAPPGVTKKLSSELFSTNTNSRAGASDQVVLVTAALSAAAGQSSARIN